MPVFEQGYRRFDGELARRSPIPAAVWHNVRTRMRWWVWLLTGGLLVSLMFLDVPFLYELFNVDPSSVEPLWRIGR